MSSQKRAEAIEANKLRVREAFVAFENKEGSLMVDLHDLGAIVRALGYNPSEAQISQLHQRIPPPEDSTTAGFITLEQCEGTLLAWLVDEKDALARDDYHTLLRAFKALQQADGSGTNGLIDAQLLRAALTSQELCGSDALSDEEAAAMVAFAVEKGSSMVDGEAYALKLATDGRDL